MSCFCGGTGNHCHYDRLTFDVFSARGPVTPDLAVLEPLCDEPFITRVERLTDAEGLDAKDVALRIDRADGGADLLVSLELLFLLSRCRCTAA